MKANNPTNPHISNLIDNMSVIRMINEVRLSLKNLAKTRTMKMFFWLMLFQAVAQ